MVLCPVQDIQAGGHHWAASPPDRGEPVFCPREAAETAIFLAEMARHHGTADYWRRLELENQLHNDGLLRVALKMATGTGTRPL
jgi:type III restriction enzyme